MGWAPKDEAELLRLRLGMSVLTAERITCDGEAQPIELLHRVDGASGSTSTAYR